MARKLDFSHPSSWVVGAHYDDDNQILEVDLKNGERWQLRGVAQDTAEAFEGSQSPGAFYNRFLKAKYVSVEVKR